MRKLQRDRGGRCRAPLGQPEPYCYSPVGQDGPLRLLEGAGPRSGPALVQQQDQTRVCPVQEPDLHRDRLTQQPHEGVVPFLVEGAERLICGVRGSGASVGWLCGGGAGQ